MSNKLFSTVIASIFAGLLCLASPAMATLYKWVDENGITQYTQTPPPKGDFSQVTPPPKPAVDPQQVQSELEKRLEGFQERRENEAKAKAEADKKAAEQAEQAAKCEQARKNLTFLQTHPRIRAIDKDGKATQLAEEERQARITQANEAIKQYCK
ncbi:DUF4124 domain-containing protein [Sulfuriflexus mobilis]|uniref:DUF4124 domain-containing protein n=1 Tax=Sulfuriflexus mobilis TaxID=1811807 RepID=UPI000F819D97|nr:DUF4124 domain-containing protein [Sulfuriflexus mobilis]